MRPFDDILLEFNNHIKKSQFKFVQEQLEQIPFREIPREYKYKFANIARRVNRPYWAIKLMNPVVRVEKPIIPAVMPEEIISYGAGLIRFGSFNEGFKLLDQVDSNLYPSTLLFKALGLISQWNYKASIPLLKKYGKNKKQNDYQRMTGLYNSWIQVASATF